MGRKQPQRLNFPIFSFLSHKDFIIVSGGGGRSDYGIQNKLAVYSKNSQLKDLVEEFNTQKDLIENLHSNGRVDLISCNSGRFCILYKIDQKGHIEEATRFVTDKDGQNTSVFNSTATILATGGEDSNIIIWKITNQNGQITAEKHLELVSHTASVENLKISEDDTLLCSASEDRTCRVFDLKTGNLVKRLTFAEESGKNLKFACCYFSLDHSHFYTIQNSLGDGPAYFTVWDMAEQFEAIKTIKVHNHAITSSTMDKTGTYMGLGTVDGCSKVLNINKLDIDCEVVAHDLIVKSVGFVNNAKSLVSVSADYSFYYLPNVRSTRWFSLLLKLWFFGILLYAIALRLNEKHKFM